MQHDPVRIADTSSWLEKATTDIRSAKADLDVTPPILTDALFHCQQAVEKALKAFLTWHDQPFRRTHDLVERGMECVALDSELEVLLRSAAPLTEYAWKYRYPGDSEEPTRQQTEDSLQIANRVVSAMVERLPTEARPPGAR